MKANYSKCVRSCSIHVDGLEIESDNFEKD
jgi:hypothetical protein